MEWFEKFIDQLAKILKEPPYLLFMFISAVFVIISLISQKYFDQTWIFFLYSVCGAMWRHITKDIRSNVIKSDCSKKSDVLKCLKKQGYFEKISIIIYHLVNIALFFFLLYYLKLI